MVTYRGPNATRISAQFSAVMQYAGEPCLWRQWVSGSTGNSSGYYAGVGITNYYRAQPITGLLAAPQMGEARFRETQLPGGMEMGGEMVISFSRALGSRDEVVWRGVTYRVEGDSVPIHLGGQVWHRTVIKRGDITA